ncbi:malto-oligosyltrehalose synthase [Shinella sp.]|uniref:malto-oligosyltrehalose synthase n=1 Tax=Shinella sp. TaxID=1870904 RepID=UPI0028983180|nr:malto-oligosyltrehalose synthase [Shinella sp.]
MTGLLSTYRLQFRNGMTFGKAARLVPYLHALGISHLYASPLMTAVSGSTHGYDATRVDEIDPTLGSIEGLRQLAAELRAHGMGLILDIVPNHMAASLENPWWRSVIVWGSESPFAHHFDIDWSEKLTLPFLGNDFSEELANGTISLALEPGFDALAIRYHDSYYPLHPGTYHDVLGATDVFFTAATPSTDPQGRAILSAALASHTAHAGLETQLADITSDPARIAAIHDAQPWRLVNWKTASENLSYRRFFEIAGLAGLRVEDERVFTDSHRLILELVQDGTIDGLRIDHIDGLADPQGYLERLRAAVGPETIILVEKILERQEQLPSDWPIAGTTGYEFIAALADAFADEKEEGRLTAAFNALKGDDDRHAYSDEMYACKRQMLADNFRGEVRRLGGFAKRVADCLSADFSRSALTEAICGVIIALPVYRTYLRSGQSIDRRDHELLATARCEAQARVRPEVREAIDLIWELLTDDKTCEKIPECTEFRTRFQQLTGPIMAKALEDTLFYRENAFIALNEVGGDPGHPPGGPAAFHTAMQDRAQNWPFGLSATSTHDTKRGEDARARLYTLSEAPEAWISATQRWHALSGRATAKREAPAADTQWLIYQALAGAWPITGCDDRAAMDALPERMKAYVEKALREAKRRTNWSEPDLEYEASVTGYVEDLLSDKAFIDDFTRTLSPFIDAGLSNALAQTLVKLTAPGVPDIYQGSERSDFSLVDPDNRATLATDALRIPAKPAPARAHFSDYKQWLTAKVLACRRQSAEVFNGPYQALALSDGGHQALAFLRGDTDDFAITVVPRLVFGKMDTDTLCLAEAATRDVSLTIPRVFEGRTVRSTLDDRTFTLGSSLPLSEIFRTDPVALLLST